LNSLIASYNYFAGSILGALIASLSFLHPFLQLVTISALAGVILVWFWGLVSNQEAVKAIKNRIHSNLLESITFRHDIIVSLKAQCGMLYLAFLYFLRAVPPLLILLVPCVLLLAQMNRYFGYQPVSVNKPVIIGVMLADGNKNIAVSADPAQLEVVGPLHDTKENRYYFRLTSKTTGNIPFKLKKDGSSTEQSMQLIASDSTRPLATSAKISNSWLTSLLYPAVEKLTSANDIKEVSINYQPSAWSLFGYKIPWIGLFFIVSFISGLLASRIFGIEV
jgi:hypothetical protein